MDEQVVRLVEYKDALLREKYEGHPIPMETFFESYIDGKIDLHGDLHELMRRKDLFVDYKLTWGQVSFILGKFIPSILVHTQAADKKMVTAHYDRGNDFFEGFLGDTMVYTSAFFEDEEQSLEEAQLRKIRLVGEKLQLKPGQKLLDVGCGWGTLVTEFADKFGVDATGVTLSKNQAAYATPRIEARGLADKARILTLDYRDIPAQKYDRISVLEMAEHVGIRKFQKFLRQMRDLLDDDGLFFLQIVGLRPTFDAHDFTWALFMSKYIFPGADASMPLGWVATQMEKAGFEIHTVENLNIHYGMTIHRWYLNWMKNKEKVLAAYGERWYRLWLLFLGWSSIVGEEGRGGCYQILAHKSRPAFDRHRFVGSQGELGERAVAPAVKRAVAG